MQNSLHTTRVRRKWKLDPRLNFAGKRKEIARIIFIANRIRTLTSRKPSNLTSFFKTIFLESTFSSISFLKTKERKRRGEKEKDKLLFPENFSPSVLENECFSRMMVEYARDTPVRAVGGAVACVSYI